MGAALGRGIGRHGARDARPRRVGEGGRFFRGTAAGFAGRDGSPCKETEDPRGIPVSKPQGRAVWHYAATSTMPYLIRSWTNSWTISMLPAPFSIMESRAISERLRLPSM